MKIKEYIDAVTAKIFGKKEKEAVSLELEDHIKCNQEFFEEIGYDEDISEDKAVGEMGSAEDISGYMTELHNDFYNPIFDIIFSSIWAVLLIGSFICLRNIIFNDATATPISIGYNFAIIGAYFGVSAINVKRNRKEALILTHILGVITIVISFLVNLLINSNGIDSISTLFDLMLNGNIPIAGAIHLSKPTIIGIGLLIAMQAVFMANMFFIFKFEKLENTRKITFFKKKLIKTQAIVFTALLVVGALFAIDIFIIESKIEDKYINDYKTTFAIVESCESKEDVTQYLEQNQIDYTKESNNKISLKTEIADVKFDFSESSSNKTDDPLVELFGRMVKAYLNKRYPLTLADKSDYTIEFSIKDKATNTYSKDSRRYLGFSKLVTKPSDLDELFDFETKEDTTNKDLLDTFGYVYPTAITINASNDKVVHPTDIHFEYDAGNGENAFSQEFYEVLKSDNAITVDKQQKAVMEILYANPKISNKDLAKKVGAKIVEPEISFEDYRKIFLYSNLNTLDLSNKDIKKMYNQMYSFVISDDLMFYRIKTDETTCIIFDSKTKFEYINIFPYGDSIKTDDEYSSFYAGSFRKIVCNNVGYYDIHGNAYKNYMDVAYYSKSGERFRYFEDTDKDGKLIEKYFIGSKGSKCKAIDGYVTLDGYFVCGDDGFYKNTDFSDSDITRYHDSKGNQYIQAQEASWDSNGNLLDFDKHYNINNN